jgi:conjugal transfer/entry exclusion protein
LKAKAARAIATALVLTLALVAGTLALRPTAVTAQTLVSDVGHTSQTILHYIARAIEIVQKATQIYNQYAQIVNEGRMIANQLQALAKLEIHHFRDVEPTLRQIEAVMQGHLLPSHLAPGVRGIHTEVYRGWNLPFDTWTEEKVSVTSSLDTFRESLYAKHLQHRATMEHLAELDDIKGQVDAAEGHEEILEAIASLNAFETEVLLLAQVSAQTSADAATAYYSHQINRWARQGRSLEEAIKTSIQVPPDLSASPGWGALPSWWSP